ncbi:hypothetical protein LTR37_003701 [Vermiconidia calcicola]|uniref:Uncharacterized protein n=1 Tax=Vermiconidia calcicola TaxID=1690605 RepID=A0ACC3NPR8_9PEZI|nr:hypothetical protein LTR37_003701 [Vermiconidia calcicola]
MDDLIAAFGSTSRTTTPSAAAARDIANHGEHYPSIGTSKPEAVPRLHQTSQAVYHMPSLYQEPSCPDDSGIWQDALEDEEWAAWTKDDDVDSPADDISGHSPALEAEDITSKPDEAAMAPHRQIRLSESDPKTTLSVSRVSQTCNTEESTLYSNPWEQNASSFEHSRSEENCPEHPSFTYAEMASWQEHSPTIAVFADHSNRVDCEEALASNPWHDVNIFDDDDDGGRCESYVGDWGVVVHANHENLEHTTVNSSHSRGDPPSCSEKGISAYSDLERDTFRPPGPEHDDLLPWYVSPARADITSEAVAQEIREAEENERQKQNKKQSGWMQRIRGRRESVKV